ncbi:MAG: hypothetical protein ACYC0T_13555 [Ramlibacter sp.]
MGTQALSAPRRVNWPLVAAATGVQVGAAIVASRFAVGEVPPLTLKHESPTRVAVFLALNPVTAAFLGWAALGERLPAAAIGALALIALALWVATRAGASRPG